MAELKQPLVVSPAAVRRLAMRIDGSDAEANGSESQLGLLPAPSSSNTWLSSVRSDSDGILGGARRSEGPGLSARPWRELLGPEANLPGSLNNGVLLSIYAFALPCSRELLIACAHLDW